MFFFGFFLKPDTSSDSNYITIFQKNHAQQGLGLNKCLKKKLQQKACFWVCSPQIVTSLRTAICRRSNVPPQPGWDTEPLVWCWKQSWSRRFRRGCYPPGRAEFPWPEDLAAQTLISDQEPSAEAARAHTQPPHSDALDLFTESPVGDQAISRLLGRFWSPFEETRIAFQPATSIYFPFEYRTYFFRITLCEKRWGALVLFHPSHIEGPVLVWGFSVCPSAFQ